MVYERIVKTFYDKLEEGVVVGRKCTRCGAVEFPPRIICNTCGNLETEWVEMSGNASLTGVWRTGLMTALPENEEFNPYGFGNIRMEEGSELNAIVCGVTGKNIDKLHEDIKNGIDVPLKLRIVPKDGYSMFVFDLVKEY